MNDSTNPPTPSTPDIYSDNPVVTLDYQIAVMQAAKEGKPYQVRDVSSSRHNWYAGGNRGGRWSWSTQDFRIDPASRPKKTVPMTGQDLLEAGATWIKLHPAHDSVHRITTISGDRIEYACWGDSVQQSLGTTTKSSANWSSDGKSWHPFTKEIAQ